MDIVVIGAGNAGCAMARLFQASGYNIRALVTSSKESASAVAEIFPNSTVVSREGLSLSSIFESACLLLFSTKDDQLAEVIVEVSRFKDSWAESSAVHISGGSSISLLGAFEAKDAKVGVLHPCFPIPSRSFEIANDNTCCMTFEGDKSLARDFDSLLNDNGIQFVNLPRLSRSAYHAATVFSAGHVMSLLAKAEELICAEGLSATEARKIITSVTQGIVKNLREAPESVKSGALLTGPFVREDSKLIESHCDAIKERVPGLEELYLELGELTSKIANRG